jgi:hypothetical protein
MGYKTFWHITPYVNLDSIAGYGVLPEKAKGKRKLVWLVKWRGIAWALAHCSARHGLPVGSLVAIRVLIKEEHVKHHRLSMYYTDQICSRGFKALRGDQALSLWERQRSYIAPRD